MNRFWMKICIVFIAVSICGCKKFLDKKPDKNQVIPATIQDLQAMLNDINIFVTIYPTSGEMAADDYYLTTEDWRATPFLTDQNTYIWDKNVFNDNESNSWSSTYRSIYSANIILDAIEENRIINGTIQETNDVKGQALFFRSYSFFCLLQLFSKQYDASSAVNDLGIALRLSSNFNKKTTRSTVQQCYEKIISDLETAATLLNEGSEIAVRPNKYIVSALLARIYLVMGDYNKALLHANKALTEVPRELLDYNDIDSNTPYPFELLNKETIFYSSIGAPYIFRPPIFKTDTLILKLYEESDLRKALFFSRNDDNSYSFRGSYSNSESLFSGITTAELLLIRAECNVRNNNIDLALYDLNKLLTNRYREGSFIPVMATDANELLIKVLQERRKELIFRGLRWLDLRRLNKNPNFAITLKRIIDGVEYKLLPNSDRYVFPIPDIVIGMTGIEQNP